MRIQYQDKKIIFPFEFHQEVCEIQKYEGHTHCGKAHATWCQEFAHKERDATRYLASSTSTKPLNLLYSTPHKLGLQDCILNTKTKRKNPDKNIKYLDQKTKGLIFY